MTVPVGSQRKRDPVLGDLLDGRRMLVQVELTADPLPAQPPDHARLVSLGDDPLPVPAEYFDTTRTVDPQTQRRGLLFLTGTSPAKLAPGMALAAHVGTGGAPETGVVVPRAAVVRFNGAGWVYLQTGEDTFVRRGVALDRPLIDGWFVGGELEADAEVVVTGAQLLLSEELKGRGVGE
ncbi:MAG: hypothetical protein MUC91_06515, partial [Verrucomicrobia bacterium]|nr:hypothetical protein [Verrucomicrobiota bacterium]